MSPSRWPYCTPDGKLQSGRPWGPNHSYYSCPSFALRKHRHAVGSMHLTWAYFWGFPQSLLQIINILGSSAPAHQESLSTSHLVGPSLRRTNPTYAESTWWKFQKTQLRWASQDVTPPCPPGHGTTGDGGSEHFDPLPAESTLWVCLSKVQPGFVAREGQGSPGAFRTCPCPGLHTAKAAICSRSLCCRWL